MVHKSKIQNNQWQLEDSNSESDLEDVVNDQT